MTRRFWQNERRREEGEVQSEEDSLWDVSLRRDGSFPGDFLGLQRCPLSVSYLNDMSLYVLGSSLFHSYTYSGYFFGYTVCHSCGPHIHTGLYFCQRHFRVKFYLFLSILSQAVFIYWKWLWILDSLSILSTTRVKSFLVSQRVHY